MMEYIVDRIEGDKAVCEKYNKSMVSFFITDLFVGVKEGDWFYFDNGKAMFLEEKTNLARNKNILLQKSLFEE